MKVKIFPEYPFSLVYGGIEIRSQRTLNALKKIGVDVDFLNYYEKDDNYDILHIFGNPPSIFELVKNKGNKKIVISSVNGFEGMSLLKSNYLKIVRYITKKLRLNDDYWRLFYSYNKADAILCLNKYEKEYLVNYYNVNDGKIFLVNNAVDNHFFYAEKSEFYDKYKITDYVLFTGNLVKRKNPLLLSKALNRLNLKGVFIGSSKYSDPDYFSEFLREIENSNGRLIWLNELDSNNSLLASAYANAKLFCLPSEAETQPQSALEALVAGKNIILGNKPYALQWPFHNCAKINFDLDSLVAVLNTEFHKDSNISETDLLQWDYVAELINSVYRKIVKL